jgi:hypothetical protein
MGFTPGLHDDSRIYKRKYGNMKGKYFPDNSWRLRGVMESWASILTLTLGTTRLQGFQLYAPAALYSQEYMEIKNTFILFVFLVGAGLGSPVKGRV